MPRTLCKKSRMRPSRCVRNAASPTFKKQVTAAGFQLKGSGWYVTDFRGGNSTGAPAPKPTAVNRAQKPADSGAAAPASTAAALRLLFSCPRTGRARQGVGRRHFFQDFLVMASIRRWLLAGLLVLVPLAITLWVLDWIVGTLDQTLLILPGSWHPDKLLGFHIPGFGVLLTLLIVLLMGAVASNFFGKKLVRWGNSFLSRIPIVRSIYSSVKAGVRHGVLGKRQCLSQGPAGAMAA
jgi:hypothetical protein